MANNALASGSVVLTANADQMVKGLKEAEAKAEQSFHKTESKLNKATNKFLKHEGGFIGAVGGGLLADFGLGGITALTVGAVLALQQIGKPLLDLVMNTKGVKEELEKSVAALTKMEAGFEKTSKAATEWRAAFSEPSEKLESFEAEVRILEEARTKLKDALKSGPRVEVGKGGKIGEVSFGGGDKARIDRKATLDEIDKITERIAALDEEASKVRSPIHDPAFIGEINKATLAIDREIDAWGKSAEEAKRAEFIKRGALDETLEKYDAAAAKLKAMKEAAADAAASLERPLRRSTSPFLDEINRVLRDPKRYERMEYNERGSGRFGMLGSLVAMGVNSVGDAMKPILEDSKKLHPTLASAVESGTKEGYSLSMRNQFGNETGDKLVDIKKAIVDGTKQMTDILRAIGVVI